MARRDEDSGARGIASLRRAVDKPASRKRPERAPSLDRLQHPNRNPADAPILQRDLGPLLRKAIDSNLGPFVYGEDREGLVVQGSAEHVDLGLEDDGRSDRRVHGIV